MRVCVCFWALGKAFRSKRITSCGLMGVCMPGDFHCKKCVDSGSRATL